MPITARRITARKHLPPAPSLAPSRRRGDRRTPVAESPSHEDAPFPSYMRAIRGPTWTLGAAPLARRSRR
eukprot:scaffold2093_cov425-Prasinococcus_capsulatus_cf.AAC.19